MRAGGGVIASLHCVPLFCHCIASLHCIALLHCCVVSHCHITSWHCIASWYHIMVLCRCVMLCQCGDVQWAGSEILSVLKGYVAKV